MSQWKQVAALVQQDTARTVLRDEKYVWAATGGPFEWKLALGSIPAAKDFEFLKGTIELAMRVIEEAMKEGRDRFTGFDDISGSEKIAGRNTRRD